METGGPAEASYVLGHEQRELRRLTTQARVVDPITRRFLLGAGLKHGMRVLDVGSGAGDVAFLAADIVGESGSVTGADRSAAAIEAAAATAKTRGLVNVSFLRVDLHAMTFAEPFDAVVGRYALPWVSDRVATLRALARHVRPGGIIAFHEIDWRGAASHPPAPLWDATCQWVADTIRRSGAEVDSTDLYHVFELAGLGAPTMRLEAVVGGGAQADPIDLNADLALTVAGTAEELGVSTVRDIDPDTLHDRLRAEVTATGSVLIARSEIGAWARAPGGSH